MSSTFGSQFRITTYGESHCRSVGVIVDGCPSLLPLTEDDIQPQLDRRRPGQSDLTTPRNEADRVEIQSGTENGLTLGTPIGMIVRNKDQRPGDYATMREAPRPSHADFTYISKYGIHASSGGGRSSARETIGRVAAGAVAEKLLHLLHGTEIVAWVNSAGTIETPADAVDPDTITRAEVDRELARCPHAATAHEMEALIAEMRDRDDSLGGTICCVCRNLPAGLGEPVFDELEAKLAHAMLSIPATKGFEIGSGFAGTRMRGSQHNDPFVQKEGRLGTVTNNSGGIQGGISNGEPILFKVAFKPAATIAQSQQTADFEGNPYAFTATGRHDPCVLPRAIPIVESMAALVLIDAVLRQQRMVLPSD